MGHSIRKIVDAVSKTGATLVGVTKGRSADEIRGLWKEGLKIFAENRVQEAGEKWAVLKKEFAAACELHLIGHLQTNKVKEAVALFDVIQSVDSIRLLKEICREAERQQKNIRVLIQVNISRESQKFGILPDDVLAFFRDANPLLFSSRVGIEGLMAIVENTSVIEARRPYFRAMKRIFEDVASLLQEGHVENMSMKYLSIGMSGDFEIALEEGANMIRIGRRLFEG